jgi:hypothetical protein
VRGRVFPHEPKLRTELTFLNIYINQKCRPSHFDIVTILANSGLGYLMFALLNFHKKKKPADKMVEPRKSIVN